jgi:hypothetical protein
MESIEARVAALEKYVTLVAQRTSDPVLGLLNWLGEEQLHDLGRTRGKLLALEAFARAAIATAVDRPALARALEQALRTAEADALAMPLPEPSFAAATAGLAETADSLRRELAAPRPTNV